MNFKALALGAAVGFLFALTPSCGSPKTCDASNCAGCCDSSGTCVNPGTAQACGAAGQACKACASTETCTSGQCVASGGGTDAGTGCGPTTCPTGCCSSLGAGGICLLGTNSNNCGTGGAVCQSCNTGAGQTCTNQQCVTPDAGAVAAGTLGSACTTNTDCGQVGGNPNICKRNTTPSGLPYPNGYCTRRCISDQQCGSNGTCVYGLGPFGEVENICLLKCDLNTNPCKRASEGYLCLNFGSAQQPDPACWINDGDGGVDYPMADAGPAAADGITGAACTDDTMCQPPDNGSCIPGTLADGGPSIFTGGACTSDCSLSLTHSWCGDGGMCVLYADDFGSGQDPFVFGLCERECQPDGGGTPCRTGYACDTLGNGRGICTPRCDNPGYTCGQGTCNAGTGLCQ